MGPLLSKLCKNENKRHLTLSDIFTKTAQKYLEIQYIEFIQRNHHWLIDDFRISCKTFIWIWTGSHQQILFELDLTNRSCLNWISPTNRVWTIRLRLPRCLTFIISIELIELFSNPLILTPNHCKMFVLELPWWISSSSACRFQISRGVNCIMVLLFLTDGAQLTLVWCTVDKTPNKAHVRN